MGLTSRAHGPDIRKHLLRDEGEVIVDEVRHHGRVYVRGRRSRRLPRWRCWSGSPFVDLDLALAGRSGGVRARWPARRLEDAAASTATGS